MRKILDCGQFSIFKTWALHQMWRGGSARLPLEAGLPIAYSDELVAEEYQ
jgi:hypothetical protein